MIWSEEGEEKKEEEDGETVEKSTPLFSLPLPSPSPGILVMYRVRSRVPAMEDGMDNHLAEPEKLEKAWGTNKGKVFGDDVYNLNDRRRKGKKIELRNKRSSSRG